MRQSAAAICPTTPAFAARASISLALPEDPLVSDRRAENCVACIASGLEVGDNSRHGNCCSKVPARGVRVGTHEGAQRIT